MNKRFIFSATCPDGPNKTVTEFIDKEGEIITRDQALRFPFTETDAEAQEELKRRRKLWSIAGDVFATDENTKAIEV